MTDLHYFSSFLFLYIFLEKNPKRGDEECEPMVRFIDFREEAGSTTLHYVTITITRNNNNNMKRDGCYAAVRRVLSY